MSRFTRPLLSVRLGAQPSIRAGPSRIPDRTPRGDSYLAVRAFFTRQASVRFRLPSSGSPRWPSPHRYGSSQAGTNRPSPADITPKPAIGTNSGGHAQDYTPFIRRLIHQSGSLTHNSPNRPTKDELLAAAGSWFERLGIRLKWFTIRGWRRFNTDDLSAFTSWFVVGNTLWILIGTTTFVSAVLATLNSLSLQEYVARWISDYLTSETGVTVVFESAIVPKWGASTITFHNVYVSRRPKDAASEPADGRPNNLYALPPAPVPLLSAEVSPGTYQDLAPAAGAENYTMFDLNLEEVEVTLSFMRWLDGKGLVRDAKLKGVRGVIDRRSVWWDHSKPLVPAEFRHTTRPGDFELEFFHVEDALVTVYQPGGQRPYNVSVFNAAVGPLRKRWLFYDILSAEAITGQLDNCLYSLHMPQKMGKAQGQQEGLIKRMARLRIDGVPIEHAQYATGDTAPMSWITSGKLDAVLDIKFPHHPDEKVDIKAILEEIGRNVSVITHQGTHPDDIASQAADAAAAAEASSPRDVLPGQQRLARPPLRAPHAPTIAATDGTEEKRQVTVDIDLRFRDLKAAVPMFTSDLSVRNNALIRPIVAFINANRTLVPIHCQVASDLTDFDGSWTLFETGLMTSISDQIYAALAHHTSSEAANSKRIRQVSFWGIQKGAEVLLDTVRNVVDPVHAQLLATI